MTLEEHREQGFIFEIKDLCGDEIGGFLLKYVETAHRG